MPGPHFEVERVDGPGDPWKWSIYYGKDGPLIQMSEGRYPSTDAAKRAGSKVVLAIRPQAPSEGNPAAEL